MNNKKSNDNIIELLSISKTYKKKKQNITVLSEISYGFKRGIFYYISGKSGIGKTTLIEILGMVKSSTSGNYFLNNKDIKKMSDDEKAQLRNKEIGFIFQDFHLISTLTAIENVMIPIYLDKQMSYIEKKNIAKKMLKLVGLKERINHFPKELSGGEQQRVAIARALINNPNIILADEPTGSLDKENFNIIMQYLADFARQGKCVIVVSHDPEIQKYSDINLVLNEYGIKVGELVDE